MEDKGNKYDTFTDMCDFYNVSVSLVYSRIRRGYTLKEALTTPIQKSVYDHNGRKFDSINEMCSYYNIDHSVYFARMNRHGWSQKDALTIPVHMSSKQYIACEDHLGNHYINLKQMCDAYDRDYNLFLSRRKHGWTIQEALLIPRNMYIGEYRVAECLKRLNVKFYHDCTIKTIFIDLGISVDWNDFLSELQSKLGSVGYNWSKQKIQRLRPDFVLYTDEDNKIRGVIEFDGEQHQNYIEFFFKTIEEFYRRSDVDFVKQSFWEYMNIPMLRIRHDQIDMIDNMVQDFIDKPQNYIHNHNTYLSEEEYWSILTEQKQQIELAFAI